MGVDVDAYAGFGIMTNTEGVKEIIKTLDYYINDVTDSMKVYDSVELSAYSGDDQFFGILVGEFDLNDEENLENSIDKMREYIEQAQSLSKMIDKPVSFHVFTRWW